MTEMDPCGLHRNPGGGGGAPVRQRPHDRHH
jgi:hypothetical protein